MSPRAPFPPPTLSAMLASLLPLLVVSAFAQEPASTADLAAVLRHKRVNLSVRQASLDALLDDLGRQTGVPFQIDLKEIPSPKDLLLTLDLQDVPARVALDLVCADHRLAVENVEERYFLVTVADSSARRNELRIQDITWEAEAWPWRSWEGIGSQTMDLPAPPSSERPEPIFDVPEPGGACGMDLINYTIMEMIARGTWESPERELHWFNGSLLMRHRPDVLNEVEHALRALRRLAPRPMAMEWGIVDLPAGRWPARTKSTGGPVIVSDPAERKAWNAVLGAPEASWHLRRRIPIHPFRSISQGGVPAEDTPPPGGRRSPWCVLIPTVRLHRAAGPPGMSLHLLLEASLPSLDPDAKSEPGISTQKQAFSFDLESSGLAVIPLDQKEDGSVLRALVVTAAIAPAPSGAGEAEAAIPIDPEESALREKLERPFDLTLPEGTFDEQVAALRKAIGANCHVTAALRSVMVADQRREALRVEKLPLRLALDLLARRCGLSWRTSAGVILLDTLDSHEPLAPAEILDVRDLEEWEPSEAVPLIARAPLKEGEAPKLPLLVLDRDTYEEQRIASRVDISVEALQDMIKQTVHPESWASETNAPGLSLDSRGALWVKQTPTALREIGAFLDRLRAHAPPWLGMDYAVLEVATSAVASLSGAAGLTLSAEDEASWWSGSAERRILHRGCLSGRAGGSSFAAGRESCGDPGPPADRAFVITAQFGTPSPEGVLPLALRIQWVRASCGPSAPTVAYAVAGYDGAPQLARGRTHLLVLGEPAAGRSLVALLRWDVQGR